MTNLSLRDEVAQLVRAALYSPVSGPVNWTPEKIAAADAQAEHIADAAIAAVMARLKAPSHEMMDQGRVALNRTGLLYDAWQPLPEPPKGQTND